MIKGFFYHLGLTLRLNFASKQPLVYGYAVPLFFLIAFGTVFRTGNPPLIHQMSQLLTISALGGACFGLPTALVAERERGWWRRYRLLPRALVPLLASTLAARFVLIASAGAMQVALARAIYGTPLPAHWAHFAAAYLGVAWAFLGMGLLIAALASDVPAVQALGQCIFLPLIMIGGVGVPLLVLPNWAQRLASFLPGRYAVDALQAGFTEDGHGSIFRFNLLALLAMGLVAGLAGARLFRWDQTQARVSWRTRAWIALAVLPWVAVGVLALRADRWHALALQPPDPALAITEAEMATITYAQLPPDDGTVTPIAPAIMEVGPEERARLDTLKTKLETWAPAHLKNPALSIRNLLSVASIADIQEDPLEGPIARTVLDYLYGHFPQDILERGLAWAVLDPSGGLVVTSAPELDLPAELDEGIIRTRDTVYAVKFLGRVRGRINN
jgi:ABC-type multidrug transport system permease subunit